MGAPEGDLYNTHVASSLNWQMSSKWSFNHMDDVECAEELDLQTPGISLMRFFDDEPF